MGRLLSISDDDLCSTCTRCIYVPGELSACAKAWPGQTNASQYVTACGEYKAAKRPDDNWIEQRLRPVRLYDNGGKTFDRYTVIYMDEPERCGGYAARGMSQNPFHGFGQCCTAYPGAHLGRRIDFDALPEPCKQVVLQDLTEKLGATE